MGNRFKYIEYISYLCMYMYLFVCIDIVLPPHTHTKDATGEDMYLTGGS